MNLEEQRNDDNKTLPTINEQFFDIHKRRGYNECNEESLVLLNSYDSDRL